MNLSRKTALYSLILAIAIVLSIMAYMYFLMPGLYVQSKQDQDKAAAKDMHAYFLEHRSYRDLKAKSTGFGVTLLIPYEGYNIKLYSSPLETKISLKNDILIDFLDKVRSNENFKTSMDFSRVFTGVLEYIAKEFPNIEYQLNEGNGPTYIEDEAQYIEFDKSNYMIIASVSDQGSRYTNYVLVTDEGDGYVVTTVNRQTPLIDDIRPVILNSIPMISLSILLVVLVASMYFSRSIVQPIEQLSAQAEHTRVDGRKVNPLIIEGEDEIASLSRSLNTLYAQSQESYLKLQEENKRQLNFLRATGHQLKTPISSALLLVSSMQDEVGSFADPKKSLPILKQELSGMQRMIGEILSLNKTSSELSLEDFVLSELIEEVLGRHKMLLDERRIQVKFISDEHTIKSDLRLMQNVLDNIVGNVVKHARSDSIFTIRQSGTEVLFSNQLKAPLKVRVEDLFEPFTSVDDDNKSSGLGLYIARYYSSLLDYRLEATVNDTEFSLTLIKSQTKFI